eukprot:g2030.t1
MSAEQNQLASQKEANVKFDTEAHAAFAKVCGEFRPFHTHSLNVVGHLITTPLCFLAIFLLVGSGLSTPFVSLYIISLLGKLPERYFCLTAVTLTGLWILSVYMELHHSVTFFQAGLLFIASYIGQDLLHVACCEQTYQSTYMNDLSTFLNQQVPKPLGGMKENVMKAAAASNATSSSSSSTKPAGGRGPPPGLSGVSSSASVESSENQQNVSETDENGNTVIFGINVPSWATKLAVHTYYLLPLCFDAFEYHGTFNQFMYWFIAKNEVLRTRLDSEEDQKNMKIMREWIRNQKPEEEITTHWWYNKLPNDIRKTFDAIAQSPNMMDMFVNRPGNSFNERMWQVDCLDGMNEIYVASLSHNNNSDKVFYTDHIDGPFCVWPGARVYRCMVSLNPNKQIKTCFTEVPTEITLTTGDAIGFDFNREIHLIKHNEGVFNDDFRMALKIHYVVYPKCIGPYGRLLGFLTTQYDILARNGFLQTLQPKTAAEKSAQKKIMAVTKIFCFMERYLGSANLYYVICLAFLAWALNSINIFVLGTSYIHYICYMNTYYHRDNVSWGAFLRNVIFFKSIAVSVLAIKYIYHLDLFSGNVPDLVSIAMVIGGYTYAGMAAKALGVKRTYFGVELGLCKPKWITAFPYNLYSYVPHPMIIGGVVGLCGFHKLQGFRDANPFLVPIHVFCYILHMIQEHYDFHKPLENKEYKKRHLTFEMINKED